ncbi:hypothetical protein M9H77_23111 [Catharanthus roseus]|uniref:Uncharacterized protein n=1 Tax=Catharanthus roseus TaxID=4058 RepID=A0ACC0AWF0_CATRO|nr:hypothetical protein M9H77_23111 [Catharanthus roseus]
MKDIELPVCFPASRHLSSLIPVPFILFTKCFVHRIFQILHHLLLEHLMNPNGPLPLRQSIAKQISHPIVDLDLLCMPHLAVRCTAEAEIEAKIGAEILQQLKQSAAYSAEILQQLQRSCRNQKQLNLKQIAEKSNSAEKFQQLCRNSSRKNFQQFSLGRNPSHDYSNKSVPSFHLAMN